jgi:hypothetical protein
MRVAPCGWYANKMVEPTIESALRYFDQSPMLTDADRAHLKRWLAEVRNPLWMQIAEEIGEHGELPNFIEGPYSAFIWQALRARASATESSSSYLQRKMEDQRWREERADLLALADELDKVNRRYRNCKLAQARRRPPPPGALTAPPSIRELEAKRSLDWLSGEGQRLRKLAERESKSEPDWGPHVPERISRQSGGKGKHKQSRPLGAFSRSMVNWFYEFCGRPNYPAVAEMANIAFPRANVSAEYIRLRCRPTTRAGRGRKTGTPKP